ncbi:MAG: dihydrofolate reductase [Bacteriophage sp.]|nr:MAG: dihydrofolate reductase [Bacteriophage sp.]
MYKHCKVTQIYAVSNNRCIGDNNQLPWRCKADLQHFKQMTLGKVCIMGRKTFDSLPKPLEGRKVVVITRDHKQRRRINAVTDHYTASTVKEALELCVASFLASEIMVVGGRSIYEQTMEHTDHILESSIDCEVEGDSYVDWVIPDHIPVDKYYFAPDSVIK